jgi:short subunit fatty acids transporter
MNQPETGHKSSANRLILLVIGDFVAMFFIVLVGRVSHAFSAADFLGGLWVAAPFIISWFLVTPWFGLFRPAVSQHWRSLAPRLLLAWCILGLPLAMVLRALFLGRSIPEGIVPVFALVMLGTTTVTMLLWRLVYIWLFHRLDNRQKVTGLGS